MDLAIHSLIHCDAVYCSCRLLAMTREAKMKELQMLDAARRKFMSYTQQQKETELARLDDDIRRKVTRERDLLIIIIIYVLLCLFLDQELI